MNRDGLITMVRVKDFFGQWLKHPQDERLMVKANAEKGEQGEYLVIFRGN
jgi:hypothetical protein